MKRAFILALFVLASPAFAQDHAGHNPDPDWGVKIPTDPEIVEAKVWKDVFDQLMEIQNARAPGSKKGLQEMVGWMALNEASIARQKKDSVAFLAAIKKANAAIARHYAGK
jgi:hypothetical protein